MKLLISVILAGLFAPVLLYAQNKSVYTSTRTGACKTISSTTDEGGSYEGECLGVAGYKVRLREGDIRQTLDIIAPGRKKFELDFWRFYGGFSSIGERIEWRTRGGLPVALIARYNVANAEDPAKGTSYLMVSKVGRTAACVTDVVMPGADQNKKARELADLAQTKPCKTVE